MSVEALGWVLRKAETTSHADRLTLIALADFTNDDGQCWPAVATLVKHTRLSERGVQKALRSLEDSGFIEKVGRTTRGCVRYRLHLGGELGSPTPPQDVREGGEQDAPDPSVNHQNEPSENLPAVADAPPRLTKIDGRDIAFDKLAEVCRVNVEHGNRARDVGIALNGTKRQKGIREMCWREMSHAVPPLTGETWERALAVTIEARAREFARVMPGAVLTPMALAKWWADLPGMGGGSAADAAAVAADEMRRIRGRAR